ncbi:MAG: hypothetical protein OEM26_08560 [Saprospiraceae bacterium]|nr:hypothetical protein [Saprospiraceae bacterium]
MTLKLAGLFALVMVSTSLPAQIIYSHNFTKKLHRAGIDFVEPVEGFYKVRLLKKDDLLKYDMVIQSKEKDLEMRFVLDPKYKLDVPHLSFFNLATSLATNEQRFNIKLNVYPPSEAKSLYGADWAAYSDFIPKRTLTDKYYARLISIFREGLGMAHQIILFNRHEREVDVRSHTISFRGGEQDLN